MYLKEFLSLEFKKKKTMQTLIYKTRMKNKLFDACSIGKLENIDITMINLPMHENFSVEKLFISVIMQFCLIGEENRSFSRENDFFIILLCAWFKFERYFYYFRVLQKSKKYPKVSFFFLV